VKTILKIFSPPVFGDEVKNHQAFVLNIILWAFILLPVPYVIGSYFLTPETLIEDIIISLVGEAINGLIFVLIRRGHLSLASIIQVISLWGMFTTLAFITEGVHSPAYLLGYGLVILIAGILLGVKGASAITILSITIGAIMVFLEAEGLLSFRSSEGSLTNWVVSAVLFPVGLVLQYLATRSRNRALAQARASEEKFSKIFLTTPDVIAISRMNDGVFIEVNPGFETISGYSRQETVGKTALSLDLWADPIQPQRMKEELREKGEVLNQEIIFRHKDGSLRTGMFSARVIHFSREPAILFVIQDITERKRAETERDNLIHDLQAKNAELERFTYTVSHDLKSPLITIRGFLGLLEKDALSGQSDLMRVDISRISDATEKMRLLLDELLELSRIGRLMNPFQNVAIQGVVREAVQLVHGRLQEKRIEVKMAMDLPVVCGDLPRLVEVMQNLIDNAAKFMGDQPEPCIEIGQQGSDENDMAILFVRDNGIGIEPRYHERIFELFDKLDPHSEGTGVGLALVKRIINVHGGRIWVESRAGEGATFLFTLPLAKLLVENS
jgi:PAS domain S-box-containing protein